MFTTFVNLEPDPNQQQGQECSPSSLSKTTRPKRHQVSRACTWCRTYRIKCDSSYPCRNCKAKGRVCSDKAGKDEVRTYPLAMKEIDRLKDRVRELEEQLETCKDKSVVVKEQEDEDNMAASRASTLHSGYPTPLSFYENKKDYNWDHVTPWIASSNQQCYGLSSSSHFISQMTSYLDNALQQRHSNTQLNLPNQLSQGHTRVNESNVSYDFSQSQEQYLLGLFWTAYHCIWPILDEAEVRAYHKSLWETSAISRLPSALIDILLAISIQHVASTSQRVEDGLVWSNDGSIVSRWFYSRCQTLLANELEGPSVTSLQCHFFSMIWLGNAGFVNEAHRTSAMTIRTGIMLGLHLEPPEYMSNVEKDFRRRLWWTLYALEIQLSMELGLPISVRFSQVSCSVPDDCSRPFVPLRSSASMLPGNNDWPTVASFTTHFAKQVLATRAIYTTFYRRCADVLGATGQNGVCSDSQALEGCAHFLHSLIGYHQAWLHQVPECLKSKRKCGGQSFSTDGSLLEVEPNIPHWLQRQRLFLELAYHSHSMSLYRPFIRFSQDMSCHLPLASGHAISCVKHAITITRIVHQILTETEFLNGWPKVLQWQWNATLTLIAYVLAYPAGSSKPAARKSVSMAIAIFELLSTECVGATSAANIARDLSAKADLLADRFQVSAPYLAPIDPFLELSGFGSAATSVSDGICSDLLPGSTGDQLSAYQATESCLDGPDFSLGSLSNIEDLDLEGSNLFDFLDFEAAVQMY
ncbi:fungal-specific transcription factor domain-domain-containing protein [Clohesyomyces aquaticus]|uniref:Fungal-specific transcription factor domain-domain-containing protein n=1 Tax=Clohesyomyces aquaticus TaxID=1231657 RepID=A0A1Y2AB73_9PLEO|nr:fungal-specific transcription factor domain-domain-containing protein [Clohesyomyces aquaticus]